MDPENVGVSPPATSGLADSTRALAPGPEPAQPVVAGAQAGNAELVAEYQSQLEEQRSIQSGLQRRANQLTEQVRLLTEERDALKLQADQANANLASIAEEFETAKTRMPELEAELGTLKHQLDASSAQARRAELVATEFPLLSPLLDAGGLPVLESEDDFRAKATKILSALGTRMGDPQQGIKPPASPPAASHTGAKELGKLLDAAREAEDWAEYKKLSDKWHEQVE